MKSKYHLNPTRLVKVEAPGLVSGNLFWVWLGFNPQVFSLPKSSANRSCLRKAIQWFTSQIFALNAGVYF